MGTFKLEIQKNMKLIGLGLLGLASADVGAVYQEVAAISKQISKIESHDTLTTKLGVAVNKDIKVHKDLAKNLKQRSAAQRGACSLHWSLCPKHVPGRLRAQVQVRRDSRQQDEEVQAVQRRVGQPPRQNRHRLGGQGRRGVRLGEPGEQEQS